MLPQFLLFAAMAYASTNVDTGTRSFSPGKWSRGIHLAFGAGVSASAYFWDFERQRYGTGLAFKTEAGYFFSNAFAFELSSDAGFTAVRKAVIWETRFYGGVLARLPGYNARDEMAPYARAFGGWGPTVIFYNRRKERLHLNGPAGGLGLGFYSKMMGGRTWYGEISAIFQAFRALDEVVPAAGYPLVISNKPANRTLFLINVKASVGLVAF